MLYTLNCKIGIGIYELFKYVHKDLPKGLAIVIIRQFMTTQLCDNYCSSICKEKLLTTECRE